MALYLKKELEESRSLIGVWQITETEDELRELASVPSDEMEEISFISSESLRKQRLAVRALLCELFGEKVYLSHHDNGKPYLENSVTNISITHTAKYVAVILNDNEDVGIDIESIRHAEEDLIERTMNEEEQRMIRSAAQPDRMFTRLWTQKEAVVKAEGTGICSFEQLQTLLPANKTYRLETIEKEKYIYTIAYKN